MKNIECATVSGSSASVMSSTNLFRELSFARLQFAATVLKCDEALTSLGFFKSSVLPASAEKMPFHLELEAPSVISQIEGCIYRALIDAEEIPPRILIAELKRIKREPNLWRRTPYAVRCTLAGHYRRAGETRRRYIGDIIEDLPIPGRRQPTASAIKRAANIALKSLHVRVGRPPGMKESLAEYLGALFLRYNDWFGSTAPATTSKFYEGSFVAFLDIVLEGACALQKKRGLKMPSSSSIATAAVRHFRAARRRSACVQDTMPEHDHVDELSTLLSTPLKRGLPI